MSGGLLSIEQAQARLMAQADASRIEDSESVALAEADGRVLAEAVCAAVDLPPWPNSAMDGFAFRHADLSRQPLPVSQKIFAGMHPGPLQPGSCARIFTGAPLPPGADTVEMQENAELLEDGRVRFAEPLPVIGRHVRPQAGEARRGEEVLARGTRLGPTELGLAASLGAGRLRVVRRLRVALLSTGDEIVELDQPLGPGQIYNSNRYLLHAWLRRLGCDVVDLGILPDDPAQIRTRLDGVAGADLILSTGGVSVGEADFLGQILREQGELIFWKLAIKPGKPLTCGQYRGIAVIGLPGNPASTLVTFALLARPYLLRRLGVERLEPLGFEVPASFDRLTASSRREYLQARVNEGRVVLHSNQSSGVLRGATWADGLVEVPEHRSFRAGEPLRFIPYAQLLA
ncbi:molybdopterin molybdotransferase MoeA [Stutzerimonas tarimensis]|uniref:Molybdopterin molybdenumtransferase n=1 Tax=Stutzerimonas tarimensis TaxID=1507735 RepID=A0ABV7T3D2_9GAMM